MSLRANELTSSKKGFTLLELLIVIAIIVLLGIILIFALNPAETLAKSRDAQRISDLSTIKTAIAVYATTVSPVDLDASISNHCLTNSNTAALISYSSNDGDVACVSNVVEGGDVPTGGEFGGTGAGGDSCRYANASTATDGTGWLPVNLNGITGGSPISALPLDPTNTVGTPTLPVTADLVYRYACQHVTASATEPEFVFELNATLESTTYAVTDNLDANDGGDNAGLYEVGTSVGLMGSSADF